MGVVDAGVDDGDLDVVALEAEVLPDLRCADVRHPDGVVDRMDLQAAHGHHVRERRERRGIRPANLDPQAVVGGLHLAQHATAPSSDIGLNGVLACLEVGLDRVLLGS